MDTKELMYLVQNVSSFRYLLATDGLPPYYLSNENKVDLFLNKQLTSFGLLPVANDYKKCKGKLMFNEEKLLKEAVKEILDEQNTTYITDCLKEMHITL